MRVIVKTKEVPYCDCFVVEEEFLVAMPEGCFNSSVVRISNTIHWLKSTMMKGIIQSSLSKESKAQYSEYNNYVKKNNHLFKPKKPKTTISHKIEKQSIG